MATELKSNRVLNYDGSHEHWEGWSEKTLARGKRKGYKKLLTGRVKIPTASEYELALLGSSDEDQEIVRLAELNEEAYEDIILSIDHTTKQGKVAFSLVKNCKTAEFPEGNCKLAWDRLEAKYAPKTEQRRVFSLEDQNSSRHGHCRCRSNSTFFGPRCPVKTIRVATKPLTINLPDGSQIKSTQECELDIPWLSPAARNAHIVPGLALTSLVSIKVLCDAGCKVGYDGNHCRVLKKIS